MRSVGHMKSRVMYIFVWSRLETVMTSSFLGNRTDSSGITKFTSQLKMTHCILNVFYFHNINKQVQSALEQNGGQIQFIVASYIFRQYYSMLFA